MCQNTVKPKFIQEPMEIILKIPCTDRLVFLVTGLSFLQPALTGIQFYNLTLVASALVLGSRFHLTEISYMWLKEKSVSTLSYFFSHAKISTPELQRLYLLQTMNTYDISNGYFIIDDTMKHHTKFCKWIHGVFFLFDHAANTNLKAACIVFLYYSDGGIIKFPIAFRTYYKENDQSVKWQNDEQNKTIKKYDLAIEMIKWATETGFPKCTVLADSWFCTGPFIKQLQDMKLNYVLEVKANYKVKIISKSPKYTPTGRIAKNQTDKVELSKFFSTVNTSIRCGFLADLDTDRKEKALYITKVSTVRFNSIPGKHRVVESQIPETQIYKYLLTNRLIWEAKMIISTYSHRWVIEEFFKNAKQFSDMEGATLRSKQGVTLSLCLVSWIDFLLHLENYKHCVTEKSPKESLTIPSIIRKAQHENMMAFVKRVQEDNSFVKKWCDVTQERIYRKRKERKELAALDCADEACYRKAV
ncbi:MAG TPA: hypothetical protein EYH20_01840 [Leucothrix sp.]|nr:hypothetical protein [Leucothrix sp.]